mmetsp:Transcript_16709/g.68423  ORF Transcript_16709/g.68423 Transcript_16709/m.68423 type:complete len:202 (-) Transcript_16709:578-1183(-)
MKILHPSFLPLIEKSINFRHCDRSHFLLFKRISMSWMPSALSRRVLASSINMAEHKMLNRSRIVSLSSSDSGSLLRISPIHSRMVSIPPSESISFLQPSSFCASIASSSAQYCLIELWGRSFFTPLTRNCRSLGCCRIPWEMSGFISSRFSITDRALYTDLVPSSSSPNLERQLESAAGPLLFRNASANCITNPSCSMEKY